MVFSASAVTARDQFGSGYHFLLHQLLWLVLGTGGMMMMMNVDYRKLCQPEVVFTGLFAVLVLLVGAFFLDKSHATHRWIRLGPASLQPSELAKLAVIFYLAWFLDTRRRPEGFGMNDLQRTILPALGPVLALIGLVVIEPDLGTAVEMFIIAVAMLYVAGLDAKYIIGAGVASLPVIYLLVVHVSYRYQRVMAFLNPMADPQGRGFQLLQSLIAVGSGGFTGVGLMESKQKLFYLPEAHTDFIYAVVCEEMGFIGGALVLGLFAVYGWRGMRSAFRATDEFGRFAALGITVMVLSQALINLGVVLGMMPTKGIPLPFISYGGSSLLVMLVATGVLLNISQQAE
jgi:cell division protein FtsW